MTRPLEPGPLLRLPYPRSLEHLIFHTYPRCIPVYKATGNDGVSAKLLRIATPAIADSLCKLINFCIEKQTFPPKWKVGKVTPIYKGQGNRDDKNNYGR